MELVTQHLTEMHCFLKQVRDVSVRDHSSRVRLGQSGQRRKKNRENDNHHSPLLQPFNGVEAYYFYTFVRVEDQTPYGF